jgi:hypothetical protein
MDVQEQRLENLRKILGKPSKASPAISSPEKGRDLNKLRQILGKPIKPSDQDEYTYGQRALQPVRGAAEGTGGGIDLLSKMAGYLAKAQYLAEDMEGKPFRDVVTPESSAQVSEQLRKASETFDPLLNTNFAHSFSKPIDELAGKNLAPKEGDLLGNVLHGGGEFLSLIPGTGYLNKAKKGLAPLGKVLAADAATGAAVGAIRNAAGKEHEGKATLLGGLGVPFAARKAKSLLTKGSKLSHSERALQDYLKDKVGEEEIPNIIASLEKNNVPENFVEGYNPTTAEVANNPILAGMERAFTGQTTSPEFGNFSKRQLEQNQAILNKLNDLVPPEFNSEQAQDFVRSRYEKLLDDAAKAEETAGQKAAQKVLDDFEKRETIQEAGAQVRRTVADETVEPIKQQRRKQAKGDYEVIEDTLERGNAEGAHAYLDRKLKNASGNIKDVLKKIKKSLKSRDNEFISKNGKLEKVSPRVGEIHGVKQSVDQLLKEQKPGSPLSAILTELSDKLEQDLAPFTAVKQASSNYKKASEPLKPFEKHPTIKNDIARNIHKEFKTGDDKVIGKYLKGDASKKYAKDLYQHIKHDKKTTDAVEGYINSRFVKDVVDPETGRVNTRKLENFKREYSGAFELYPGLDVKLANNSNATKMYNELTKSNAKKIKDYQKNAAYKLLTMDPDKVAASVLKTNKSTMQMDEIVTELSKDKTGNSKKGMQRSMAEHIMNNFRTLGEDNTNLSINKMNNLILNKTKTLGKLFDKEQMDSLNKIHKSLLARNKKLTLGKTSGSETAPKLNTLMDVLVNSAGKTTSKWASKVPGAKLGSAALDMLSEYRNRELQKLLTKTLMEPEFAKVMFTNIQNMKAKEVKSLMGDYLKRSAIRTTEALNREEEED